MKEALLILLVGVLTPFVGYFTVKFGTYAYHVGRRRFREDSNGKTSGEKTEA